MQVNVIKRTDRELEIEMDADKTIAVLVKSYLQEDENVEFAAYRMDHPLENRVRLYVRVKNGDPKKVLQSAIERAKADFITFQTAFEEALK